MSIAQIKKQCPVPETLCLKRGALVMMRKNDVSYPHRYVNGSIGTITEMSEDDLLVQLLDGPEVLITREVFSLLDGNGYERAAAENFPLTLAWATTIHKAQGASIDRLMVNLSSLWESGHAYVALSRAQSEQGLFIESWDPKSIFIDPLVQEFYTQVHNEWEKVSHTLPTDAPDPVPLTVSRKQKKAERVANHELTYKALESASSMEELVDALSWTEDTIIKHIERLFKEGKDLNIAHLKPDEDLFRPIAEAFEEYGLERLKPVYEALGEKYSYRDLKVVRLFLAVEQREGAIV